jgi:hypothetical protein
MDSVEQLMCREVALPLQRCPEHPTSRLHRGPVYAAFLYGHTKMPHMHMDLDGDARLLLTSTDASGFIGVQLVGGIFVWPRTKMPLMGFGPQ